MRHFFLTLALLLLIPPARGQRSPLALDAIMQGESYVGPWPGQPWWAPDSKSFYYRWNRESAFDAPLFQAGLQSGGRRLDLSEERMAPPARLVWDESGEQALYSQQGDLFLWRKRSGETRRLTATVAMESDPAFARAGQAVTYRLDGQLFALELSNGVITQLTDLRKGKESREPARNPRDQYLYEDQERLFGVIARHHERETANKTRRDSLRLSALPRTVWLDDQQADALCADPTLQYITWRQSAPARPVNTQVSDHVTASGYTRELRARPKVGEELPAYSFHCYDRLRDSVFTISLDSLPGIRDKPGFLREYHRDTLPFQPLWDKPRPVIVYTPLWSAKGLAVMEIRAADNKDRWLVRFDPQRMAITCLDHQRDTAWIGGPGIFGALGWLADGETCWFQSEVSGFSHLYTHHIPGGRTRALTSGSFEVLDVRLSGDKKTFYLRANAEGPFEQHFYHLPVSGGPLLRITREAGCHEVAISPDDRWLAIRYSSSNRPWEIHIMENKTGASMRRLTHSPRPEWEAYPWREPEIVMVPASDGAMVPARLYRPDPDKANGSGVIFVHGAGYLQNVHRWWSSYFREYMFHNLLCDEGYTVLDMDYRASSGYGREWRTAIYRHMGGRDLEDHIDGARFLVDALGVFPERIGIYGGSYGGFITLMALFRYPGTFACGAALRSVTDWAHYNHPYTANILNTPAEDSLAYRRSSPIEFSHNLRDPLLILHGMVDVNVQFQDVVRLSQRLIEAGKEDWELAVYPVEDHGFTEPSSWADEYRRIYKLFETYLREAPSR